MKIRALFCVALIASAWLAMPTAAEPVPKPTVIDASTVGRQIIVHGRLGLPVGEEVTISGQKVKALPLQNIFVVEKINDQPLGKTLRISVEGIEKWPDNTAATLRGCEVGRLSYLQWKQTNFGTNDKRWTGPYQELSLEFEPAEVLAPRDLKLETNR